MQQVQNRVWKWCVAGLLAAASTQFTVDGLFAQTRVATKTGTVARPENHPLAPVLKLADSSREAVAKVQDYSGIFLKTEVVKNRQYTQTMQIKFRQEPMSVYLKYYKPHAGREVIYIEGQNGGKLLAHEAGLKSVAGTVALAPTSDDAMAENKYPITEIGFARMLDLTIAQWESELKYNDVEVNYYANAKLGNVDCKMVETIHPRQAAQFRFHRTRLYIDQATNLPVRVEQYGFPTKAGEEAPLLEEYTYTNLKTNVGLTDADFSTSNPDYGF